LIARKKKKGGGGVFKAVKREEGDFEGEKKKTSYEE